MCPKIQGLSLLVLDPVLVVKDELSPVFQAFPSLQSLEIGVFVRFSVTNVEALLRFARLLISNSPSLKHYTFETKTDNLSWTAESSKGVEDMLLALPPGLSSLTLRYVYWGVLKAVARMLDRGFLPALEEVSTQTFFTYGRDDFSLVPETADIMRRALKVAGGKLKKLRLFGFGDNTNRMLGLHDPNPDLEFLKGLKEFHAYGLDWGTLYRLLLKEKRFLPQLESCIGGAPDELDKESIRNAFQLMQLRRLHVFSCSIMETPRGMPQLKEFLVGLSQRWEPKIRPQFYLVVIRLQDDETAQLLASAIECRNLWTAKMLYLSVDPARCSEDSFRRLGRSMNYNTLPEIDFLGLQTFDGDPLAEVTNLTDKCSHDHWKSTLKYAGEQALARLEELSRSGGIKPISGLKNLHGFFMAELANSYLQLFSI